MQAIPVRRVNLSEDLSKPGDYVFLKKREPTVRYEREPREAPHGRLRKLWWNLFGRQYEMKQIVELHWPDHDVAILNCPDCNTAFATTAGHKIISVEPLTLEIPLTCPYCKDRSFSIKDGKITAVLNG